MKEILIKKTIYQTMFALAISVVYMLIIADDYTSIALPLTFFAGLFFAAAWFQYLKNDGMSFSFKKEEPQQPKKARVRNMMDYVETHVENVDLMPEKEVFKAKCFSNIISAIILIVISFIV